MSLPHDIEGHIGYGWDMKTQRKEETVLTCRSGDVIFRDLDTSLPHTCSALVALVVDILVLGNYLGSSKRSVCSLNY